MVEKEKGRKVTITIRRMWKVEKEYEEENDEDEGRKTRRRSSRMRRKMRRPEEGKRS